MVKNPQRPRIYERIRSPPKSNHFLISNYFFLWTMAVQHLQNVSSKSALNFIRYNSGQTQNITPSTEVIIMMMIMFTRSCDHSKAIATVHSVHMINVDQCQATIDRWNNGLGPSVLMHRLLVSTITMAIFYRSTRCLRVKLECKQRYCDISFFVIKL